MAKIDFRKSNSTQGFKKYNIGKQKILIEKFLIFTWSCKFSLQFAYFYKSMNFNTFFRIC